MWVNIIMIVGCGSIFAIALWLASKNGSKAAQLEALKAEIRKIAKEQERAKQIIDNVASFSVDDVRKRLHQVANSYQRNRMQ